MGIQFTIDENAVWIIHDQDEGRPLGTGFTFIKPEWIVTAKHVVLSENGAPRTKLWLSSIKIAQAYATLLFAHPIVDLAVLIMSGESPCKIPLFPSHERFSGTKGLVCCGYSPTVSMQNMNPSLFVNWISSYSRERRTRGTGDEDVIVFPAPFLEGGHSEGPVFGEGGGVVGVIIQMFEYGDIRHGRATGIQPLLQHLDFR